VQLWVVHVPQDVVFLAGYVLDEALLLGGEGYAVDETLLAEFYAAGFVQVDGRGGGLAFHAGVGQLWGQGLLG